jgi:O-methyltransferase involved in polyketide biosynthesis
MLQTLITNLKDLGNLDPQKRSMILTWLFSGLTIWYLYEQNNKLIEKITEHENKCQMIIIKAHESCDEQLKINREKNQAQINQFIERSNNERDSIYRHFYKTIAVYNQKVNKGIEELNNLKDENNN